MISFIFKVANRTSWYPVLVVIAVLVSSTLARASGCYINIPHSCQYGVPINTWFPDDYNSASSNELQCVQRAYDYQAWCGTDYAYASYWSDTGLNPWVLVHNGAIQQMYLPAGPGGNFGVPFGNYYVNPAGALYMQNDGNFVLYQNGQAIWQSGTHRDGCANCIAAMQSDGNLVLYDGGAYWASHSSVSEIAYGGDHLQFSGSPPFVQVAASQNAVVWSSCLSGGDQNTIQAVLNTGAGAHAILCPGATFNLGAPIWMNAPYQQIFTQGRPVDASRANLVVQGSNATAIEAKGQTGIAILSLTVNGNRTGAPITTGADALIEVGGYSSGQVVDHVKAFDPRSWSALHVAEGNVDAGLNCSGATITYNDIGPAGYGWWQDNWADGISYGCANGVVAGNYIHDVSDGGIVLFGAPGTQVYGNYVQTTWNWLNGGINLVDYAPYYGNYNGVVVSNNVLDAAGGFMKNGIAMGPKTWGINAPAVYGANVSSNVFTGQNMGYGAVGSGIVGFTVLDNNFPAARYGGNRNGCGSGQVPPQALVFGDVSGSNLQAGYNVGNVDYTLCITP